MQRVAPSGVSPFLEHEERTFMSYDWRDEVAYARRQAAGFRLQAANTRHEAEKVATALEADADRTDMRADGIERLCLRGSEEEKQKQKEKERSHDDPPDSAHVPSR
jgi:hypothetical protein